MSFHIFWSVGLQNVLQMYHIGMGVIMRIQMWIWRMERVVRKLLSYKRKHMYSDVAGGNGFVNELHVVPDSNWCDDCLLLFMNFFSIQEKIKYSTVGTILHTNCLYFHWLASFFFVLLCFFNCLFNNFSKHKVSKRWRKLCLLSIKQQKHLRMSDQICLETIVKLGYKIEVFSLSWCSVSFKSFNYFC